MNIFKVFIATLLISTGLAARVCGAVPRTHFDSDHELKANCINGGSMKKQKWTFGVSCPNQDTKTPLSLKALWTDEKGQSSALKLVLVAGMSDVVGFQYAVALNMDNHKEGDNTFEFSLENGDNFALELQLFDTDCVFNSDSICPIDEVKGYERICNWKCLGDEMDEGEKEEGTMEECAKMCDEKKGCTAFHFTPKGWEPWNRGKVDDSGLGECEFFSKAGVGSSGDFWDGVSCVRKVEEQSVEEQSGDCKDIEYVFFVWIYPNGTEYDHVPFSCDAIRDHATEKECTTTLGSVIEHFPESHIPLHVQGEVTLDMTYSDICPHVYKDLCNTCATPEENSSLFDKVKKKFEEKDPVYLGIAGVATLLIVLFVACCCSRECQGPQNVQKRSPNRRAPGGAHDIVIIK